MREAGASFKVAKNTLARLAVKVLDCEVITDHLTGPTAIAYSADPVAAAKIIAAFAKGNDKMKILGGSFKGKALSAADVQQLASLPSLDELRGKLIGLIQAPAGKIARLAQEPAAQLARLCSAYGQKA
jgi:large subunit ribosomal protein L10